MAGKAAACFLEARQRQVVMTRQLFIHGQALQLVIRQAVEPGKVGAGGSHRGQDFIARPGNANPAVRHCGGGVRFKFQVRSGCSGNVDPETGEELRANGQGAGNLHFHAVDADSEAVVRLVDHHSVDPGFRLGP